MQQAQLLRIAFPSRELTNLSASIWQTRRQRNLAPADWSAISWKEQR